MKKLIKSSLVAIAAIAALGTQTFAASGQTDVSFNFPNIVILHYISDVQFDIPATIFGSDSIDEGTGGVLNTFVSPIISGDAAVSITTGAALNSFKGTINNAWAVRALAGAGGVDVSIAIDTAEAHNGASSYVHISNATVTDGTQSGATINFSSPGLDATNAVYGAVKFDIDFTATKVSGMHTGAQYTVTAVAI